MHAYMYQHIAAHSENTRTHTYCCPVSLCLRRPVAGFVNLCPSALSSRNLRATVKHELLHALVCVWVVGGVRCEVWEDGVWVVGGVRCEVWEDGVWVWSVVGGAGVGVRCVGGGVRCGRMVCGCVVCGVRCGCGCKMCGCEVWKDSVWVWCEVCTYQECVGMW